MSNSRLSVLLYSTDTSILPPVLLTKHLFLAYTPERWTRKAMGRLEKHSADAFKKQTLVKGRKFS